jgi:hypothetical protein
MWNTRSRLCNASIILSELVPALASVPAIFAIWCWSHEMP